MNLLSQTLRLPQANWFTSISIFYTNVTQEWVEKLIFIFKGGSFILKMSLTIFWYLVVYCFLLEFLLVENPKLDNSDNDSCPYLITGILTFKRIIQYAILISHFDAFTKGNLPMSPYYIKYFHTEWYLIVSDELGNLNLQVNSHL